MLISLFSQNIDTCKYAIECENKSQLHAIARADYISAELSKNKIRVAGDRLHLFNKYTDFIIDIEAFLVELNNSPNHDLLKHKWQLAIDIIGNFNCSESQVIEFAYRLEALSSIWSSLTKIFYQLKGLRLSKVEPQLLDLDKYFQSFVHIWEKLWIIFLIGINMI
ncbi:MAG: hypothetical protein HC785_25545 [Calothrix sp. CSU_2_0]|nr:hypothetical protein [Calothrix sp. CSU_2_0]